MTTLTLKEYEDIRITVPWGHIAGRWYGNRQVRPILALHGWLDNLGTFNTLIPLLPAHVGILCIDLPGHGHSSHYPAGIRQHVEEFVPCIIRVMKEYRWQRVSLLGHSLGGVVSHLYATMYPHTVDMLISLDIITPPIKLSRDLNFMANSIEKFLMEDERARDKEPPARTYEQLVHILNEGSMNSVDLDKTKHLLERSIKRSLLYPDKYYFSRDGRLKHYQYFISNPGLAAEMARRIKNIPYLVIRGSDSFFIDEVPVEVIDILRAQNPHFELHEIQHGTHHVHLNNPVECAKFIVPFIHRHRPAILDSWSLEEDTVKNETPSMRRKARELFFAWQKKRSKKIKPKSKL